MLKTPTNPKKPAIYVALIVNWKLKELTSHKFLVIPPKAA